MYASPNDRYSGDINAYLLPEFDEVFEEFENLPKADYERYTTKDLPKSLRRVEKDDYEQEIENLKKRINFLVERERKLEVQLLEYYGLKEQEKTMMELHNRLKINSMEAKLLLMKIDSLKAENKRLEAQVSDYSKVVSELETAKAKIKVLKRKIRYESEHNKEQILDLTHRVTKLQEQEQEHEVSTSILMTQRGTLQNYVPTKGRNENLKKEVERLQVDRCGEVEELVYLRWINACLRYELRNYQPPPGKQLLGLEQVLKSHFRAESKATNTRIC
ncbi:Protein CHUP1 chloroplastic [Bienertia sinuspersici]